MASSRGGSINSLSSDINVDLSETWKKKGKKVSDLIGMLFIKLVLRNHKYILRF